MKKTILITGASSGFGRETAKLFNAKGWNVIATMRTPEREKELIELGNILVTKLDVTNTQSIKSAVAAGIEKFGGIDVLVNNAGYGAFGELESASEEEIRKQFDVNLFGLIAVTQAVLPEMRARREGVVINVSSVGGKVTFPYSSLYHATKFALEGLTESVQYELNQFGIRMKIVEPGGYKTEFAGRSMSVFNADGPEDYKPSFEHFITMIENWPMSDKLSEVADAIYEAATDGTEKLRYPADVHAAELIQTRHQMGDVEFKKMMAAQFSI
jgi:NAD(P)-dependent dehydrogenase (short-subunit alcohol dehydrogenase family)